MGLVVSHGAFDASYSAFNRFRRHVLRSIGGSWIPHDNKELAYDYWYWWVEDKGNYSKDSHKGLYEFFSHSDCDGIIEYEMCRTVADELEEILPLIKKLEKEEPATGQLHARGGYVQVTKEFINGCRLAYERKENLEFR